MGLSSRTRQSGQAAVEAALTFPLMVFMLLGTFQLFMMMHGRILTQLAAFQATRAGSLTHNNCGRMVHAAILQVMPAIEPFARPTGASVADNLANAFARVRMNTYGGKNVNIGSGNNGGLSTRSGGNSVAYNGAVVWIVRDLAGRTWTVGSNGADDQFDQNQPPMRLETQLIFWFPMRVPFANWVIGRAMLAHYGLRAYTDQNPLMIRQRANWTQLTPNSLAAEIKTELAARMAAGEYVFPIVASYTMRMMTPLKDINRLPKNCPPTPNTL